MAKALYGHVGVVDPRLEAEMSSLRRRVRQLEDEVARLGAANDALTNLITEGGLAGEGADSLESLDRVELPADVSVAASAALTGV